MSFIRHLLTIQRCDGTLQEKGAALQGKSILEVVKSATEAPVRNNGGGHYNHSYASPSSSYDC
jgi:superoxide dismutase